MIEYNEQELREQLAALGARAQKLDRIMPAIGQRLVSSVHENFMVGGRYIAVGNGEYEGGPQRWKPSKRAKATGGQTLVRKHLLAKSISATTSGLSVTVGTNLRSAAILHYGGDIEHPGGTAYVILSRRSGKELKMAKGVARFIKNRDVAEYEAKGRTVRRTRPHRIHLDARPFLVIQPEDYEYMGTLVVSELVEKTTT